MTIDCVAEIEKIMQGIYPGSRIVHINQDDDNYEGYAAYCFGDRTRVRFSDLIEMTEEQLYKNLVPANLQNRRIAIIVPCRLLFSTIPKIQALRKRLLDEKIIEVVSQPSDIFDDNPYARVHPYMKDMAVIIFSENNTSIRFRYDNIVSGQDFEIVSSYNDLINNWNYILLPTMIKSGIALSDYAYKLEDIASVKQGYNLSRRRPFENTKIRKVYSMDEDTIFGYANRGYRGDDKEYKYLVGMNNISDTMIMHNIQPVTVEDDPSLELSKLKAGDVVLAIRGVYLKAALVDYDETRNLYATNDVCRIRPHDGVPGLYILAMLESDLFTFHLHLCAQLRTLRVSEIKSTPINCLDPTDTKWMRSYVEKFANDRDGLINARKIAEYKAFKMKEDLDGSFKKDLEEKFVYECIAIKE